MKEKYFIITIIFTILSINIFSQTHWASKVIFCSSEYSPDRNSASEILGVPNVDPQGRPSPFAWAVEPNELNKEGVEWAYIDLEFDSTYMTRQIAIFQSLNPGAISLVLINPVRHNQGDSLLWKLVYFNKEVIEKTGLPKFLTLPDSLYKLAGKIKRRYFPPDKRFKPQKKSDILHIFLPEPIAVRQIRIVINTLAIDGWNQIDAVGISNSLIPIKYPQPHLANQGLILQTKPEKIFNTEKIETNPVVYPDGKFLFFSRKVENKQLGIITQNIYMAQIQQYNKRPCASELKHQLYKQQKWTNIGPIPWHLNSPLPNSITGFSSDGRYMYLRGYFKAKKSKLNDIANIDGPGLYVSTLDSIPFSIADSLTIRHIDTSLLDLYDQIMITPQKDLLLLTRSDTIDSTTAIFFMIKSQKKWSDVQLLGYAHEKKLFTVIKNREKTKTLWLQIDSIGALKIKATQLVWGKPKPLKIQGFSNLSNNISIFVSAKNKVMFLAIEDSNSLGRRDLYISFYDDSTQSWTKPQNLGSPINTVADESSPYLDGDGRTLYFASAGHFGYGGYDLYVTYRQGESWLKWSEPQNLGPIINTPGDELNISIHQPTRKAYYISTGDINSCTIQSDIYAIKLAKPVILHITGHTLCCQSDIPLGDVNIALVSVQNNTIIADRTINFKSNFNGSFNIKIARLIDASRLGHFGLIAWRDTFQLCNYNGEKIKFLPINLQASDWIIEIDTNIHLTARCTPPMVTITKPTNKEKTNKQQITKEKPQKPLDTTYVPKKIVTVYGNMKIDTIGCPVIYHRGILYAMTSISPDHPNPFVELDPVYVKYFKYNQSDISINENTFHYLLQELEANLSHFKTVNVYLVASASKVPTQAYCSNFELARMRAENLENRIRQYLKNKGIPEYRIFFDKRYVVEGPEYQNDPNNITRYKPYQYVKAWIYSCSSQINK